MTLPNESEPSQPISLNNQNQAYYNDIYNPQIVYTENMPERPPKSKKKGKKGKANKNNMSMSNRSGSGKWGKIDPYLQNMPPGMQKQILKQAKSKVSSDQTNTVALPPISKQAPTDVSNQPRGSKVYKPLGGNLKMKKANSISEQISNPNIVYDDEMDSTRLKGSKNQAEVDYEKKNLERLQKMQMKKAQELAMMEEQRKKAHDERERLRQIVFKRAEEHRKIREQREEEDRKRREEEEKQAPEKPKKKKVSGPPSFMNYNKPDQNQSQNDIGEEIGEDIENGESKNTEENSKLKKYFKNRYVTFLKSLKEENSKKKEEEEKAKQKEERLKTKMLQKLGIDNVRSRFMSDTVASNPVSHEENRVKRSASIAGKNRTHKPEMSRTSYNKNVGTPKNSIRNRLNEVKEFDEQLEEQRKQEVKAKKEANDRIKKKQEEYLKNLADKKRLESEKEQEEQKRQQQLKQNLRAKVKEMLDNVERKPKQDDSTPMDENNKDNKKMDAQDLENFLKRNVQKKKVTTTITDFDVWKKRNKVDKKTKVFICQGGYNGIRKALTERGWVENKDANSP